MKTLLSCLLFFIITPAEAVNTLNITVDPAKPTFQVKLPANPTTGFQWSIKDYDKKRFEMVDGQFTAPQTKLIGAGGTMVYTFKLQPGKTYPEKTKMLFKYARSWEPESATYTRVLIKFNPANKAKN
ncbi:protease inhibitor I42 family protein [Legionella yabuuchiae]|uniref:protease inhibitor I42 family protein n=1 Tax=Legionella yabuuchiae TaxID=376727 RepID=UPI001054967A|nr:protease inhibitor I42 family protein [Legionella yabuuchiae]